MTEDDIHNRIGSLKDAKWRFNKEVDEMLSELENKLKAFETANVKAWIPKKL